MPKATLVAPSRPGGCQSLGLSPGTALIQFPSQMRGKIIELRVPPTKHGGQSLAAGLGREEGGRKGRGEARHH